MKNKIHCFKDLGVEETFLYSQGAFGWSDNQIDQDRLAGEMTKFNYIHTYGDPAYTGGYEA